MTSVDRIGFQLRLRTAEGVRGSRIALPRELSSPGRDQKRSHRDGGTGAATLSEICSRREDRVEEKVTLLTGPLHVGKVDYLGHLSIVITVFYSAHNIAIIVITDRPLPC
jgi:hypothetical protein